MRISIAVKLAFAAIATVVLCIVTMAWVTSRNIEHGFLGYLNALQAEHLDQVRDVLAEQYRERGDFEWLRDNPRLLSDLMASHSNHEQAGADPSAEDAQPLPPPPPARPNGPQDGPAQFDRPRPPPPVRPDRPPPRRPPAADLLGFGPRLTLLDANGQPVIGPPHPSPGLTRTITVDGKDVGTLVLAPLDHIPSSSAASAGFLQQQSRDILKLAAILIAVSTLLAVGFARLLLRPIFALRRATADIARGKFGTRVSVFGGDELATLTEHVNAMARALDAGERQRRKLLADVSHELRTPLSVMRGEIEAMQDGVRPLDARALASLHQEVLHLNKLIEDLHQLALADAGRLHYDFRSTDLTDLAGDTADGFEERATRAGLQLTRRLPEHALIVHADAGRITQVLTNLIENSIRYTDSGGTIALSLRQDGKRAELCIEDSAPGIPDGMHASIFDRMHRIDEARSRKRGGSGLGLAICKAMVEAHGGIITALPSALGGLKIVVNLPLTRKG